MATAEVIPPDRTTDKPPRPRRWIPVSLRVFLVILAGLGVAGTWRCVHGYRQLLTVREVERVGGFIHAKQAGPEWLRGLLGDDRIRMFDKVDEIAFFRRHSNHANDDTLRQIGRLGSLKELHLSDTGVTDQGLEHLMWLGKLEILELGNTQVTDVGLAHLKRLENLELLNLRHTQVTDAGLAHLKGLTGLKRLNLNATRVTDRGLAQLKELTNLEILWLDRRKMTVSEGTVIELERTLPGLHVIPLSHRPEDGLYSDPSDR
jgi:hypothetical protein